MGRGASSLPSAARVAVNRVSSSRHLKSPRASSATRRPPADPPPTPSVGPTRLVDVRDHPAASRRLRGRVSASFGQNSPVLSRQRMRSGGRSDVRLGGFAASRCKTVRCSVLSGVGGCGSRDRSSVRAERSVPRCPIHSPRDHARKAEKTPWG